MELTRSLSLTDLSMELIGLWELREDTPPEERGPIEVEIQKYIRQYVQKVDGVAGWRRELAQRIRDCREAAAVYEGRAKTWEAVAERIDETVMSLMVETGDKKLQGKTSSVRRQSNPVKVVISQPDLIPRRFQQVSVKMNAAEWFKLGDSVRALSIGIPTISPEKEAIRKALEADALLPEDQRKGVPGAKLDRGEHLRWN